jgi:hypothetical protein
LHSLARNHALVGGDKRLALAALIAFYGVNGPRQVGDPMTGHTGSVNSVAFDPKKGTTLASGGDGAVILRDFGIMRMLRADPVPSACEYAGRGLTEEEWRSYVADLDYIDTCRR